MERFLLKRFAKTPVCKTDVTIQDFLRQENRFSLRPAFLRQTGFITDDVARPGCARPSGPSMRHEFGREGEIKREVIEGTGEEKFFVRGDSANGCRRGTMDCSRRVRE
jgi:hypothetical protein